jgi:hypothetical protein
MTGQGDHVVICQVVTTFIMLQLAAEFDAYSERQMSQTECVLLKDTELKTDPRAGSRTAA